MGFWSDLWYSRSRDWQVVKLAADRTPDGRAWQPIEPGTKYVSVRLKSARIVNTRRGLKTLHGVVHSTVSLPQRGERSAFQRVTSPNELRSVSAKNLDRVVTADLLLAGPVPYWGGNVALEAGLFSVETADLAAPFIDTLQDLSSVAGLASVAAALPFVEPIQKGVERLTGTDEASILEIGLLTEFEQAHAGWIAVIRAERDQLDPGGLTVNDDDFRLEHPGNDVLKKAPYLLFEISTSDKYHTWFEIPELRQAYQGLTNEVRAGTHTTANDALMSFKRLVLTSPDLLPHDGKRLWQEVKAEVEQALGDAATSGVGGPGRELRKLEEIPLFE